MSKFCLACCLNADPSLAAELEGDGIDSVPAGAQDLSGDNHGPLPEINFDDGRIDYIYIYIYIDIQNPFAEDPTNLHRHARQNAQEAIALAKQRAEQFDAQVALQRKTNEALKLAKSQVHVHEGSSADAAELVELHNVNESKAPLVDC